MAELILMMVQPLMLTPLMSDNQCLKAILTKSGQEMVMKGHSVENKCSGISATYLRKWSDSSVFQVVAYEVYITQINLLSSSWSSVTFISSQCVSWLSYSTVIDLLVLWFTMCGRCFSDGVLYNASYLLARQKIIRQLGKPITHIR